MFKYLLLICLLDSFGLASDKQEDKKESIEIHKSHEPSKITITIDDTVHTNHKHAVCKKESADSPESGSDKKDDTNKKVAIETKSCCESRRVQVAIITAITTIITGGIAIGLHYLDKCG